MPSLPEIVTSLDRNEDVHLARILVLLKAFQNPERPAIEGITKLAKLDFLLRYPSCLKKALEFKGVRPEAIPVDHFEELTIEAKMVRYRFGPWDHRYRRFLNILAARGLVRVGVEGKTIQIDLTDRGHKLAEKLVESPSFERVQKRASLLEKKLNIKARALMELIYGLFPELNAMSYNEDIDFVGPQ
jgi:hypothetical protein